MRTEKIITIDLDFICPEVQDIVEPHFSRDISPEEYWNKIMKETGKKFTNNWIAEFFVLSIIREATNNGVEILLVDEHQDVLKHLDLMGDVEYDIINIDQHHDISYGFYSDNLCSSLTGKKYSEITEEEFRNLENCWVKYLMYQRKLKNYTWVCNNNSHYGKELLRLPYRFFVGAEEHSYDDSYGISAEIEREFIKGTISKLIICKSGYYIPAENIEPILQALEEKRSIRELKVV